MWVMKVVLAGVHEPSQVCDGGLTWIREGREDVLFLKVS